MFVIGVQYTKGQWIEKNLEAALNSFQMADRLGHLYAGQWSSYIYWNKRGVVNKTRGFLKLLSIILPFVYTYLKHPNSDRLRR